jgi:hypothetical protein
MARLPESCHLSSYKECLRLLLLSGKGRYHTFALHRLAVDVCASRVETRQM